MCSGSWLGSVCSHLWHWAFGEGEKTVAEAEQMNDLDLLVCAFYSTLKLQYVSVVGNSGLLVWIFRVFKKKLLICLFLCEGKGREMLLIIETYPLNCAFPGTGIAGVYNQKNPNHISFFFSYKTSFLECTFEHAAEVP